MAEETKKKKFTVLAESLTVDKPYRKGQTVELSDAKVIKTLTDKKLIK